MSLTSVLGNLDSSGSGKSGNPSYLGSVLSTFCRDRYKPHACSQCLLRRVVISLCICTFQCIKISCSWLNLISCEGMCFTMESNIGRNKSCVRLIVREFCLMSGQEMVLSGLSEVSQCF